MVYRGTVRGGLVVLEAGVHLPDGLDVNVEPVPVAPTQKDVLSLASAIRNGVPLFHQRGSGSASDLDIVNRLRDEAL